eukprot:COSAG06_NODE_4473_length_4217_cov_97.590092_4_plen_100_part_00
MYTEKSRSKTAFVSFRSVSFRFVSFFVGWEVDRAERSRVYLYEAVADTSDKRHKDRGGAQLVPLRHRLRNCPAHSTAAIRHLSDCERSEVSEEEEENKT